MGRTAAVFIIAVVAGSCFAEDAKLDIQVKEVKKQPTLIMKTKAKKAEIGAELQKIFPKVFAFIAANKIPESAPMAYYVSRDPAMTTFDIEAGIVVPEGTKGDGDIVASSLPAGKTAFAVHVGPYEDLPKTYAAIVDWAKTKGLTTQPIAWEVYITDPGNTKPNELKTEVYVLLDEKK
jgi:effector-binding domain-containing protein